MISRQQTLYTVIVILFCNILKLYRLYYEHKAFRKYNRMHLDGGYWIEIIYTVFPMTSFRSKVFSWWRLQLSKKRRKQASKDLSLTLLKASMTVMTSLKSMLWQTTVTSCWNASCGVRAVTLQTWFLSLKMQQFLRNMIHVHTSKHVTFKSFFILCFNKTLQIL